MIILIFFYTLAKISLFLLNLQKKIKIRCRLRLTFVFCFFWLNILILLSITVSWYFFNNSFFWKNLNLIIYKSWVYAYIFSFINEEEFNFFININLISFLRYLILVFGHLFFFLFFLVCNAFSSFFLNLIFLFKFFILLFYIFFFFKKIFFFCLFLFLLFFFLFYKKKILIFLNKFFLKFVFFNDYDVYYRVKACSISDFTNLFNSNYFQFLLFNSLTLNHLGLFYLSIIEFFFLNLSEILKIIYSLYEDKFLLPFGIFLVQVYAILSDFYSNCIFIFNLTLEFFKILAKCFINILNKLSITQSSFLDLSIKSQSIDNLKKEIIYINLHEHYLMNISSYSKQIIKESLKSFEN